MTYYIIRRRPLDQLNDPFGYWGSFGWVDCSEEAKSLRYEVAMSKLIELDLVAPTYSHEMVTVCEQEEVKVIEPELSEAEPRPMKWEMVLTW